MADDDVPTAAGAATKARATSATEVADSPAQVMMVAIAAVVASLFGLFTTIGINGEHLSRMYRNEGPKIGLALILVIGGTGLTLVAPMSRLKRDQRKVGIIGVGTFMVGVLAAVSLGILSIGTENRPELEASVEDVDGAPVINATVRYEGLGSQQRVTLRVVGAIPRPAIGEAPGGLDSDALFSIELGPGPSGDLSRTFEVPISSGVYRRFYVVTWPSASEVADDLNDAVNGPIEPSDDEGEGAAPGPVSTTSLCSGLAEELSEEALASCVEVRMPDEIGGPSLGATWAADGSAIDLAIDDDALARSRPLSLLVMSRDALSATTAVMSTRVYPSGEGGPAREIAVPMPPGAVEACALLVRGPLPENPNCFSAPDDGAAAWWTQRRTVTSPTPLSSLPRAD